MISLDCRIACACPPILCILRNESCHELCFDQWLSIDNFLIARSKDHSEMALMFFRTRTAPSIVDKESFLHYSLELLRRLLIARICHLAQWFSRYSITSTGLGSAKAHRGKVIRCQAVLYPGHVFVERHSS